MCIDSLLFSIVVNLFLASCNNFSEYYEEHRSFLIGIVQKMRYGVSPVVHDLMSEIQQKRQEESSKQGKKYIIEPAKAFA